VPLQVGRHPQDVLVLDRRPAAHAQTAAGRRRVIDAQASDSAVTGNGADGTRDRRRDDGTGTDGHGSGHSHGRHRRVVLLQRVVV
jgi:hypothetical protein